MKFVVKNQTLARADGIRVVSDSQNYPICEFEFRSDEWKSITKTAIFWRIDSDGVAGTAYSKVIDANSQCKVPSEVMSGGSGKVAMSVYGGSRITTNILILIVEQSGYKTSVAPADPTSSVYEQLSVLIGQLETRLNTQLQDIVKYTNTQPTSTYNRVWLNSSSEEITVPTIEEFNKTNGDLADISEKGTVQLFNKNDYILFNGSSTGEVLTKANSQRTLFIPIDGTSNKITAHRDILLSRFTFYYTNSEKIEEGIALNKCGVHADKYTGTSSTIPNDATYFGIYFAHTSYDSAEDIETAINTLMIQYGTEFTGYESYYVPKGFNALRNDVDVVIKSSEENKDMIKSSIVSWKDLSLHISNEEAFSTVTNVNDVFSYSIAGDNSLVIVDDNGLTMSESSAIKRSFYYKEKKTNIYSIDTSINGNYIFITDYVSDTKFFGFKFDKSDSSLVLSKIYKNEDATTKEILGAFYPTNKVVINYLNGEYNVNICGINISVNNTIITSNFYAIAFGFGGAERFNCLCDFCAIQRRAEDLQEAINSGAFLKTTNTWRMQSAQSNQNAFTVGEDSFGKYIQINCDRQYGESNVGRYRTEFSRKALSLETYGLKSQLCFEADYYVPASENVVSNCKDVIWQMHNSSWEGYTLNTPLSIGIQNGKLNLMISCNSSEPQYSGDYESLSYELCNVPYDEWFHMKVEFRLGCKDVHLPFADVYINGKMVCSTNHINWYNIDVNAYVKFGLYETDWYFREYDATTRTIRLKNVKIIY